jgi:NAD(P)H dehydrogenase (quinone)
MIKPKILITGATGKTGGAVVTELLAKGWPVRAAVRVRNARSDLLQRRGAEVVVADIFDPVSEKQHREHRSVSCRFMLRLRLIG